MTTSTLHACNAARALRLAALASCCALLAACGKSNPPAEGSQVVARVGKAVITTAELNAELRIANIDPNDAQNQAALRQLLSEMVTRKYLEQRAIEAQLDREPDTLLELMRARSQVLATAYTNRAVARTPITAAEVARYVNDNPLRFAQRVTFTTDQVVLPLAAYSPAIASATAPLKSLDEIERKLTAANVPNRRAPGSLSSAEIPIDLYEQIRNKSMAIFFVRVGSNGAFFEVKSTVPAPLAGAAADNAAQQYLRADRTQAEMGLASMSGKMMTEYVGRYARIMKDQK